MRFLPPVAALADGPVALRRRPARPTAPDRRGARRAARLGVARRRRRPRRAAVHRARHRRASRRPVTIDASASSQFVSALLLAGRPLRPGRRRPPRRQAGAVAPAHRDDRRDAARRRRRGRRHRRRTAGRSRPGPVRAVDHEVEPDLSNAAPFLAAAAGHRRRGHRAGWPQQTTQAGDALREMLDPMGATVEPRRRRA